MMHKKIIDGELRTTGAAPLDPACFRIGDPHGNRLRSTCTWEQVYKTRLRYNFIFVVGGFYVEGRGHYKSRGSFPKEEIFRGGNFRKGAIFCPISGGVFRGYVCPAQTAMKQKLNSLCAWRITIKIKRNLKITS